MFQTPTLRIILSVIILAVIAAMASISLGDNKAAWVFLSLAVTLIVVTLLGLGSQKPHDAGGEVDAAEEDGGCTIIARGEASAVLEAAEHALDGVAPLVEAAAEAASPASIGLGRDVGNGTLLLNQVADAVVSLARSAWTRQRTGRLPSNASAASTVRGLARR